ncbi:hypothetical protein ACFQI7_16690 [Paenibacillus allorhizosphaerae]|uniref:Uncharacterized protein n=1 Tax=Paenibacillus allorhizosphaerae TaxID=2849866 RepID=A0ABN7TTY2_9BACL|nr:hypothetical protein [Paenibacillus allorhizosphaerae]CAG7655757.1 hypothetical protein PAECIP111802_06197 [Paenibacillus allorhizosphaerae]
MEHLVFEKHRVWEAEGTVTDIAGREYSLLTRDVVGSSGRIHDPFLGCVCSDGRDSDAG